MQKVSDSPVRKCPSCGRLKARRRISRTSFVLKGNGWYATDYASKGRKAAVSAESERKGKSAESSEGPSPSKESSKSKAEIE